MISVLAGHDVFDNRGTVVLSIAVFKCSTKAITPVDQLELALRGAQADGFQPRARLCTNFATGPTVRA